MDGDRMLNLYIFDYCRKCNYKSSALTFYNEVLSQSNRNGNADIKPVTEFSAIPAMSIPIDTPDGGFLYEWWTVFWDMFKARTRSGGSQEALVLIEYQTQRQLREKEMRLQMQMQQLQQGQNFCFGVPNASHDATNPANMQFAAPQHPNISSLPGSRSNSVNPITPQLATMQSQLFSPHIQAQSTQQIQKLPQSMMNNLHQKQLQEQQRSNSSGLNKPNAAPMYASKPGTPAPVTPPQYSTSASCNLSSNGTASSTPSTSLMNGAQALQQNINLSPQVQAHLFMSSMNELGWIRRDPRTLTEQERLRVISCMQNRAAQVSRNDATSTSASTVITSPQMAAITSPPKNSSQIPLQPSHTEQQANAAVLVSTPPAAINPLHSSPSPTLALRENIDALPLNQQQHFMNLRAKMRQVPMQQAQVNVQQQRPQASANVARSANPFIMDANGNEIARKRPRTDGSFTMSPSPHARPQQAQGPQVANNGTNLQSMNSNGQFANAQQQQHYEMMMKLRQQELAQQQSQNQEAQHNVLQLLQARMTNASSPQQQMLFQQQQQLANCQAPIAEETGGLNAPPPANGTMGPISHLPPNPNMAHSSSQPTVLISSFSNSQPEPSSLKQYSQPQMAQNGTLDFFVACPTNANAMQYIATSEPKVDMNSSAHMSNMNSQFFEAPGSVEIPEQVPDVPVDVAMLLDETDLEFLDNVNIFDADGPGASGMSSTMMESPVSGAASPIGGAGNASNTGIGGMGVPGGGGGSNLPLEYIATLSGHSGKLTCCDMHPSGAIAASGSHDKKVMLWYTGSGSTSQSPNQRLLQTLDNFTHQPTSARFSGSYLITAAFDHTVKLWRLGSEHLSSKQAISKDGTPIAVLQHSIKVGTVVTSVDLVDSAICTIDGDGEFRIFQIHHGTLESHMKLSPAGSVAYSPNPLRARWSVCGPGGSPKAAGSTTSEGGDAKDRLVAVGLGTFLMLVEVPVSLQISQTDVQTLPTPHNRNIHSIDWSRDGKYLVTASEDTIVVWDGNALQPIRTVPAQSGKITSCAFLAAPQASESQDPNAMRGSTCAGATNRVVFGEYEALYVWPFVNGGKPAVISKAHANGNVTALSSAIDADTSTVMLISAGACKEQNLRLWSAADSLSPST